MSEALYPSRLHWDGASRSGVARHDGVSVDLRNAPGTHWRIQFIPGILAQVQDRADDPARDMSPAEVAAAKRYLTTLSDKARCACGQ